MLSSSAETWRSTSLTSNHAAGYYPCLFPSHCHANSFSIGNSRHGKYNGRERSVRRSYDPRCWSYFYFPRTDSLSSHNYRNSCGWCARPIVHRSGHWRSWCASDAATI